MENLFKGWRENEKFSNGKAPPSGIEIHYIEAIEIENNVSIYKLKILHLKNKTGKGFRATIVTKSNPLQYKGKIHYGVDESTYEKAVVEGKELLNSCVDGFNKEKIKSTR